MTRFNLARLGGSSRPSPRWRTAPLEIRSWALAALLALLLLCWVGASHAQAACEGECTLEQAETGLANPPEWAAEREIHFEAESAAASAYTAEEMEAGESESENKVGPLEYRESGEGVQRTPKVYVIFWGENFETTKAGKEVEKMILELLEGLTGSAYQGLLTQYFDSGGSISSTLETIETWTDVGVTAPEEVNQVKVEEEIEHAIKENEKQEWEAEPDAQFLLVSAPESTYEAEFLNQGEACAYHSVTTDKSENVTEGTVYGFIPYQGDPPFSETQCIESGNPSKNPVFKTSKSVAHEYAETVTDPFPSLANGTYTWRTLTKEKYPEIADLCQLEADFELPSGGYAQNLYDNHLHGCKHSDLEPPQAYAITRSQLEVSGEGATLEGTVNAVGLESNYYFEYGETKSYGSKTAELSAGSGVEDQKVSEAVSGLLPNTTYHYRVVTTNSTGETSGLDKKFPTGPGGPPTVTTESATGVAMFEAILNGTVNPNGFATTDQFEYGLTKSYGSSTPSESAGTGVDDVAKGYTLTHLTPNKTYYYQLNASSSKGSSEGEEASFKTKALEPTQAASHGSHGTGKDQFKHPAGIASDTEGNTWVVDMENDRLQKFDREGEYVTQFGEEGEEKCQLKRPKSVAIDSEGHIWVDDAGNYRVTEFNEAGECLTQFGEMGGEEGQLFDAESIAIDHKDDIWVADTYNGRLQEFDHEGELLKVVQPEEGKSGHMKNPGGITVDPEGNVWVVDWLGNRVIEFDEEGSYLREFEFKGEGSGDGQFKNPDAISVDANGAVWVADAGNDRVQVFNEAGEYVAKFGSEGSGEEQFDFGYPMGILSGGSGEVWITDAGNNRMEKWTIPSLKPTYSSSFGSQGTADGQFEEPAGIAVNPMNGNLAVSDEEHARIEVFSEKGEFMRTFGKNGEGDKREFEEPRGVAIDSEGNIWVADTGNNRVQGFTEAGALIRKFGTKGSGDGELKSPKGLAVDSEGNVWVADSGNNRVQEFDKEGKYQRQFSTGKNPIGVAVDPKDNVWNTNNEETGALEEHTETGGLIRKIVPSGEGIGRLEEPKRLAIGINGELWIPDAANDRVEVFNQKGEYVAKFGALGPGKEQMKYPVALALDLKGNVWITDNNNRIDHWIR